MNAHRVEAVLATWLGVVYSAHAQPIHEDTTYFPTPTLQGEYGFSVDIDNGIMIVGARSDNERGITAGAAYLVDIDTGNQIRLLPPGVGAGDQFGFSVAISGNYAIVGAPFDRDLGFDTGAVYIFDSSTGALVHTLNGSANSNFGTDVDIDGTLAIVGAKAGGVGSTGEAYLFDVISGNLLHVLPSQTPFGFDFFGEGVAVNQTMGIACVGAPDEYIQPVDERIGAVHLFDTTTGGLLRTLIPTGLTENIGLGSSIDMRDGLVLVGAPKAPNIPSGAGAAYIFDANTGAELLTLTIDDSPSPTQRNALGYAVKLGNGVALLGAPEWDFQGTGENFDNGAGFLFDTSTGALLEIFYPSTATSGDRIGSGVGIDSSTIALGSPGDDYTGGFGAGSVGVYTIPCAADLNNDGSLDFFDISRFLSDMPDWNNDTTFDFFDVSAFLISFGAGCP